MYDFFMSQPVVDKACTATGQGTDPGAFAAARECADCGSACGATAHDGKRFLSASAPHHYCSRVAAPVPPNDWNILRLSGAIGDCILVLNRCSC